MHKRGGENKMTTMLKGFSPDRKWEDRTAEGYNIWLLLCSISKRSLVLG